MPQSFCKVYAHLIFSTRNRRRLLGSDIRSRVHGYLASLVRDFDSPYVVVGGVQDHVHILFAMAKTRTPVEFVRKLKRESSKFMKRLDDNAQDFCWQRGYAMFSVSPAKVSEAEKYVRNQEEHHRHRTFREEVRAFLEKYGVDYDEAHVWD